MLYASRAIDGRIRFNCLIWNHSSSSVRRAAKGRRHPGLTGIGNQRDGALVLKTVICRSI